MTSDPCNSICNKYTLFIESVKHIYYIICNICALRLAVFSAWMRRSDTFGLPFSTATGQVALEKLFEEPQSRPVQVQPVVIRRCEYILFSYLLSYQYVVVLQQTV